jgi:hypothetical protein
MNDYLRDRAARKNGLLPKLEFKKPKKPLKKKSDKKLAEEKAIKEIGGDTIMDAFFNVMRLKMTGKCLFCGGNTMKKDDEKFHFSLAHLLPKAIFKSIATHPDNIIELCFWGESCHTNFDNGSISWEFIKDSKEWLQIKEQLITILPMVSQEERKHKLYSNLLKLCYNQ